MQHWGVAGGDGCWVIDHDDLPGEFLGNGWWFVGTSGHISPPNVASGYASNAESDVVAGFSLWNPNVVGFDGFYFSLDVCWHKHERVAFF